MRNYPNKFWLQKDPNIIGTDSDNRTIIEVGKKSKIKKGKERKVKCPNCP